MNYIPATMEMADAIYYILQTTIKSIYPDYCTQEIVNFFCSHHSKEHVLDGIASGDMGVLKITDETELRAFRQDL